MSRHINDHVPLGAAVAISAEHLASIESTIAGLLGPMCEAVADLLSRPPAPAVLSSEQFAELKALLLPVCELATMMRDEIKQERAEPDNSPLKTEFKPEPDSPQG